MLDFFAHFPIMMQQISIVVLVEVWVKRGSVTRETQDPNALRVRTENPNMKRLDKYKSHRADWYINDAAGKLWNEGVPLNRALGIVRAAFEATVRNP